MKDYNQIYNKFWKEIVENKDESINIDQIKKELYDYYCILNNVSKVYDHITGGRISKQNTLASEVISEADNHYEELFSK